MIDPVRVTDYNRTQNQLEEFLLFCIAVAGKNATTTAKNLERLLNCFEKKFDSPFETIKYIEKYLPLSDVMKQAGFGCYRLKSKGFLEAANSGLDLRTCSLEDLEKISGVGMKTSRYFVLHTRKNAELACLDTHILQWMQYYTGYDIVNKTPTKSRYLVIEQAFLKIAKAMNMSPADLDLAIWNKQRGSNS